MISLSDFKSNVKDVARPNRFMVQVIPNPSLLEAVGSADFIDTAKSVIGGAKFLLGNPMAWLYLTKSISLPSRSLGVLEHKRLGVTRKVAGDPTYDDLSVTFINDASFSIRALVDIWQENIVQQNSNKRQYANKYAQGSTILVEQLNGSGYPVAIYKFNDVWPRSIDASELSTDSSDAASEFTIQFAYNTWTKVL